MNTVKYVLLDVVGASGREWIIRPCRIEGVDGEAVQVMVDDKPGIVYNALRFLGFGNLAVYKSDLFETDMAAIEEQAKRSV